MTNPSDQREFTRIATTFEADVIIGEVTHEGATRDVSLKGLLVTCLNVMAINAECLVVIHLGGRGGEDAIRARGRIARVLTGAVAIEFNELDGGESYQHLANLIRYNARNIERVDAELDSHLGLKRIVPPPEG